MNIKSIVAQAVSKNITSEQVSKQELETLLTDVINTIFSSNEFAEFITDIVEDNIIESAATGTAL